MVSTEPIQETAAGVRSNSQCEVAVIWIDWYAYHVARFRGLLRHPELTGKVAGLELVGGVGVHAGLKFRESIPESMPVQTLLPASNWSEAGKWQLARALWNRLDKLNPSLVLVPGYYTIPALTAAIWARVKGRKSVLMTESTAQDHARVWWREALKASLIKSLFNWAVAGGKPHRRYLEQLGFPVSRIAGFYDVVDNVFFDECCRQTRTSHRPADLGLPSDYFLYIGRVAAEKNIHGLLSAYVDYRKSGGSWSLVVVGDGPQLNEIRALASTTPYARDIHFPGLKASSELPSYYAFASAFVLPSTREPWGLVVNEAMAAGLPVIVSDRCGCAEDLVVHSENGFTFDPSQANSLSESLVRFGRLTPDARKRMGRRSVEIISRFSPDAWAAEIVRILRSAA